MKYAIQILRENLQKSVTTANHIKQAIAVLESHPSSPIAPDPPNEPERDWHNPARLETPGAGFRFCVKGEREDPPRTQWWSPSKKTWVAGAQSPLCGLSSFYTYRTKKPLPTHTT